MDTRIERLRGKPTGIAACMIAGTDRSRSLYARFKGFMNRGPLSRRLELAQQSVAPASLEIPKGAGYRLFAPGTFDEVEEIVTAAQSVVDNYDPGKETKKAQLKQDLLDRENLTLDSPHLRFALRPDIIAAVSHYLGVVPVLADIDVWYSVFTGKTPTNSQLYHCDTNDITQVKIFIYSTAVDEASGPLTVIGADDSKMIRDKLKYSYGGNRKRVTDDQVVKLLGAKGQQPITGPAGTVAFVDSSRCFHYGSRVDTGGISRAVTVVQYLTPTAFVLPIKYQKKAPFHLLDDPQLSEMQRLVLGAV